MYFPVGVLKTISPTGMTADGLSRSTMRFCAWLSSASGVCGEIRKNGAIYLDGTNFGSTDEGVAVKFVYGDGVEVEGSVTSVGPNRIAVAFPSGLENVANGTEISVSVTKTVDGTDYVSNSKNATLVAAE